MLNSDKIIVELTNKEALVLLDFCYRFNREDGYPFEDQAERRVLWNVEAILEKQLVEVFSPDYKKLLQEARNQVRDPTHE